MEILLVELVCWSTYLPHNGYVTLLFMSHCDCQKQHSALNCWHEHLFPFLFAAQIDDPYHNVDGESPVGAPFQVDITADGCLGLEDTFCFAKQIAAGMVRRLWGCRCPKDSRDLSFAVLHVRQTEWVES